MKYRIKATKEIVELRTWKRDDGAIKLVDKYGKMGFWPDEVEPAEQLGWHPSSEHPPVDKETGFSELVVGIMPGDKVGFPQYVRYQKNELYDRWIYGYTGVPSAINIKWWCYPPKED